MIDFNRPLKDDLHSPFDSEQISRLCDDIEESLEADHPAQRARPRRWRLLAVAVAVVLCAGAALPLLRHWQAVRAPLQAAGPLRVLGGDELETVALPEGATGPARYDLDDGSTLSLSAGTRLDARVNRADRIELELRWGEVSFDIPPGGQRRWVVQAGQAEIEVVGTAFTVDLQREATTVAVDRGAVMVRADTLSRGRRLLRGGDRLVLTLEGEAPSERVAASAPEASTDEGSEARPETAPATDEAPTNQSSSGDREPRHLEPVPREATWTELARDRSFPEAYRALGSGGVAGAVDRAAGVSELFLLADVARLSGHQPEAVAPLERIITHHGSDRRAGHAAFTLGRLQLGSLGRPTAASRSFRQAIQLGLPPGLREDALARIVEAHRQAGQANAAQDAAREYLRRYPTGRRTAEVRRWSGLGTP